MAWAQRVPRAYPSPSEGLLHDPSITFEMESGHGRAGPSRTRRANAAKADRLSELVTSLL